MERRVRTMAIPLSGLVRKGEIRTTQQVYGIRIQRHIPFITSSVLLMTSLPRLICQSSERWLGSLTKISSKDGTSRTLPIQILLKSQNSGGSNKNCRIRLSHPTEEYVTCIYT